jgi:hypothetical protein
MEGVSIMYLVLAIDDVLGFSRVHVLMCWETYQYIHKLICRAMKITKTTYASFGTKDFLNKGIGKM